MFAKQITHISQCVWKSCKAELMSTVLQYILMVSLQVFNDEHSKQLSMSTRSNSAGYFMNGNWQRLSMFVNKLQATLTQNSQNGLCAPKASRLTQRVRGGDHHETWSIKSTNQVNKRLSMKQRTARQFHQWGMSIGNYSVRQIVVPKLKQDELLRA